MSEIDPSEIDMSRDGGVFLFVDREPWHLYIDENGDYVASERNGPRMWWSALLGAEILATIDPRLVRWILNGEMPDGAVTREALGVTEAEPSPQILGYSDASVRSPLRVYIAGSSRELERAESMIAHVRSLEHVAITADWPAEIRRCGGKANAGLTAAQAAAAKEMCRIGVESADLVIALVPPTDTPADGLMYEIGLFDSIRKMRMAGPVIVVGDGTRSIFLSGRVYVRDDDEARGLLSELSLCMPILGAQSIIDELCIAESSLRDAIGRAS